MSFKIAGIMCAILNALPIDKGTLARVCSPLPGLTPPAKARKKNLVQKRIRKDAKKIIAKSISLENYAFLFLTCEIKQGRKEEVKNIVNDMTKKDTKSRYEAVEKLTSVPWYVIAVIHKMECNMDFTKHLHNGDPLTQRTVHVPPGRPKLGNPPFKWEDSAVDALSMKNFDSDWSLPSTLKKLEEYNGVGYRLYHPGVNTPYLWSGSDHYTSGKYVEDGKFSQTTVSKQMGAAVILKQMVDSGVIGPFTLPVFPGDYPTMYYA